MLDYTTRCPPWNMELPLQKRRTTTTTSRALDRRSQFPAMDDNIALVSLNVHQAQT
jgi:hypothetical protein